MIQNTTTSTYFSILYLKFSYKRFYSFLLFVVFFIPTILAQQASSNPTAAPIASMDSIIAVASTEYKTGAFQKITYGNRYRKSWRTPVKLPIFNLKTTVGELKPVKKGGGQSTKSLRLEDKNGKEYVLRSVYKNGRRGVPDRFRHTVYEDVLQDLRVGAHPYSALPVATLAEAADLYHTNPTIYYLPKQEGLGAYSKEFGGELYLFEEYPNEGWDLSSFGYTEKIVGYDKLLEKVHDSPKNRVDEKWVLKSRLFDLWIGDYDRHDDQWRWAEFAGTKKKHHIYRPIPRDRDQAFFDINGVLPWILSRDFIHIQQHPFSGRIQDIKEFSSNAKYFDRTWLTSLEWKDWEEIALTLQEKLTDEVIEEAFEAWSKEIYDLNAPKLIKRLKKRRDRIVIHAQQLYHFLSKYVNIVGTDKRELFEINRKNRKNIEVSVYTLNKKGEKKDRLYQRTFHPKETKEIRLYGLDGTDKFEFIGKSANPIRVRILGGKGFDKIEEKTVAASGKRIVVYDEKDGIKVPDKKGFNKELSDDPAINDYNRLEFEYDRYFPLINFGRTVDDGFFIGGGANFTKYKFRKKPYGVKHHFFLQFSTETNALHFDYSSDFTEVLGSFNFSPAIRFERPIIFNYFGLGNNTEVLSEEEEFHWVRLKKFTIEPLLKKIWKNKRSETQFGPFFENVIVERRAGRISDVPGFLKESDRGNKSFMGLLFKHQYNSLDNRVLPTFGLQYNLGLTYYRNLNEEQAYARLEGNISNFFTIKTPFPLTIGNRIGAATLSDNNYYFFHNNNLGGNNYLRGFRKNRFAGTHIFYHNIDIRIPLFFFKSRLVPGQVGLVASFDYGRVWYNQSNNGDWKTGISPGIWWTPYKFAAINLFYTFTGDGEQNTFTLKTGFFF